MTLHEQLILTRDVFLTLPRFVSQPSQKPVIFGCPKGGKGEKIIRCSLHKSAVNL